MMKLNTAIVVRIKELLNSNNITQYRLEQNSGLSHSTVDNIISGATKDIRLLTLYKIAAGFNLTISEFLDDPIFQEIDFE